MKKTRNFVCSMAVLLAATVVTSCGQDVAEATGAAEQQETQHVTTVAELTRQLRAYDATVTGSTRAGESAWVDPSVMAVTNTRMGIVMADASGAIAGGLRGGLEGAIIGAVTRSLSKLLDKLLPMTVLQPVFPTVFSVKGTPVFSDSVGYYHNLVEAELYNQDAKCNEQTSGVLFDRADRVMIRLSDGYRMDGLFTTQQRQTLVSDFDAFRETDRSDLPFDDYCDLLKQLDPAGSDYIDFAAEYIFTVYYGNVDIDDYTEEVLFMIRNSNADVADIGLLSRCIQVAHASTIFSANIK